MKTKSFMKKMTVCICSAAMAAMLPVCSAAGAEPTFNETQTLAAQSSPYNLLQANPGSVNSTAASNSAYRLNNPKGTVSNNVQINGYNGSYHASPIKSYLYKWKGNLYRLEYTGGKIILEKYDSDFKYIGKGEIKAELPIFGGFYSGKDYNYIIFGEMNSSESNSKEIMRVVKYSKGMKRLSAKSFYGCNTYIPFDAGCPRMDVKCSPKVGQSGISTCPHRKNMVK